MLDHLLPLTLVLVKNLNVILVVHFGYFDKHVTIYISKKKKNQVQSGNLVAHRFGMEN